MPELSALGSILTGSRTISKSQWEQIADGAESVDDDVKRLLDILAALAAQPPHWWDGKPPQPPGLTEYQQTMIRTRFVDDELHLLRRDLALNQFVLLGKLGQGGQGEVYRARQLNPPRFAAVKTLVRDTDIRRRRFEQEAKAMMKIQHPSVARFYLYERVRDSRGEPTDEYLIAMEFVRGIVMHRLVHRAGSIPWKFVVHWGMGLLGGLDVIHKNGFVHGDVKPENVMAMGPVPAPNVKFEATRAKLLDFGAAKRLDNSDDDGPPKKTFVGTPEYAPPEQWTGSLVAESDIYSLGGTMFFMLTGRFPYQKDRRDPQAYRESHTNDPLLDVREYSPDVPEEMSQVIQKMMAKEPEERGTAEELTAMLKSILPREAAAPPPRSRPKLPAVERTVPAVAAAPINRPAEVEVSPLYGLADSMLAAMERLFIRGFYRPPPGEEASISERVAALLRRPLVLVCLILAVVLLFYGLSHISSLFTVSEE